MGRVGCGLGAGCEWVLPSLGDRESRDSSRVASPSLSPPQGSSAPLRHLHPPPPVLEGFRSRSRCSSSGPPSPLHHPSLILLLFLIGSPMFIFLLDLRGRESSRAATAAAECGLFLRKRGLNNSSRSSRRCGLFLPQLNSSLQCCHSSKLKIAAELNCFSLTE